MRAGQLRARITIQQGTETADTYGGRSYSWSTYATRWAQLRPLKGNEFIAAKQINNDVTGEALIRYTTGITPKMRILYGSRVFEILAVLNTTEKNYQQRLLYKEVIE